MKNLTYTVEDDFIIIRCSSGRFTAEEGLDFTLNQVTTDPQTAILPNIWDLWDVALVGDIGPLLRLHDTIAPVIRDHVRVGFVTNNLLTGAILMWYTDLFRDHDYLHFETFRDMQRCLEWASRPMVDSPID